nr:MAG TPA: LPLAT protein [Caudoviricetes sp.]
MKDIIVFMIIITNHQSFLLDNKWISGPLIGIPII